MSDDKFGFRCNALKRDLTSTTLLDSPVVSAYDEGVVVLVHLAIDFGVVLPVVVGVHSRWFSGNDAVDDVSCTVTTDQLANDHLVISKNVCIIADDVMLTQQK